ncbi:MAG: preprotein translocase subunit YajC [Bacteroidota bacterium]|nr:preprotein translocase subunit YajC [Odoribacter sp.]MDP3641789.1 preprotein translocase subunit YajC [Bacteroidota bacterium]
MNYLLMGQPAPGTEANPIMTFLPLVLIIVVFYFFMIRPQMKKQKEVTAFRNSLAKGDKVVTTGGIYGKILELKDNYVLLQIDDNVKIRVDKAALVRDMTDVQAQK